MADFAKTHIVVLGSGVIGLQTAVLLLQTGNYSVSIVAEHFPGDSSIDYTSPWAGAQWRTHASEDQTEIGAWDMQSYKAWMAMVDNDPVDAATKGIERYPSYFYWANEHRSPLHPPWFAPHTQPFANLPSSDLPQSCESGYTYPSITINPGLYLRHLHTLALSLGALTHRLTLPSPLHAALAYASRALSSPTTPAPAAFINATGIGARRLVPDPAVHAIRGQTLLVRFRRPVERMFTREDATPGAPTATYLIPRRGREPPPGAEAGSSGAEVAEWFAEAAHMAIVGGTKDVGDERAEPDARISEGILVRARALWPEGFEEGGFEVVKAMVGLRPGREGGPRVDVEEVKDTERGDRTWKVVHAYGNAGAGFQNALGVGNKVVALIDGLFES